jgi:glucokinase
VSRAAAELPALGIDIGGTKVAGGVVAPDGTILSTARRATPGSSVSDTEDAIAAVVEELAAGHDGDLVGVGIGAAGWFDRTGDTVLFSPHLAWRNSTLRKDLADRLQRPLWVGNDADAAGWAEYRYGAARGADLALMITLGTGIGGGIILGGRLQRGSHGVAG